MTGIIIVGIIAWGYAIFTRRLLHAIVNKTSAGLMLAAPEEESAIAEEDCAC